MFKIIFSLAILVSLGQCQEFMCEFILRARNLPNTDPMNGAPDSYAIVEISPDGSDGNYVKKGETETIRDNNNPDWSKTFLHFVTNPESSPMKIRITVVDEDQFFHDDIGTVEHRFGDLVTASASSASILEGNVLISKDLVPSGSGKLEYSFIRCT